MILISLILFLVAADPAVVEVHCAERLQPDSTAYATADDVIDAYFRLVSGPPESRDWARFDRLSLPTAQFNAVGINARGQSAFYPQTREEYVAHLATYLKSHGFYQREVSRRKEQYGRMAHVLSAYESRNEEGGTLIDRGLISFQLVQKEGRWWIVNVLWHSETPEYPLPAEYLDGG